MFAAQAGFAEELTREVTFNIPAQPLATALLTFSEQSGVQVVTSGENVSAYSAPAVTGLQSIRSALKTLLHDTPLGFVTVGTATIALVAPRTANARPREGPPGTPFIPGWSGEEVAGIDRDAVAAAHEDAAAPATVAEGVAGAAAPSEGREGPVKLQEIVVTAGKRTQNIDDYAGSVSALSGKTLEEMGAQSLTDYLKLVPGVTMNSQGADNSRPVIRGITTATTFIGLPQPLTSGIFVDEIPLSDLFRAQAITDMNPFDLERVEVLKGPQGTLFGSSAISGAIRYITNKPELNLWQAKLLGTYTAVQHGDQRPLYAAMVNAPIGQTAALRGVGMVRDSVGYIDDTNRNLKDIGGVHQTAFRGLGKWLPTDRLTLTGTWMQQDVNSDDLSFADQRVELTRDDVNGPNIRNSRFAVENLVGTYDFDWGTLLSNSSRVTKKNGLFATVDRQYGNRAVPDCPPPPGPLDPPPLVCTNPRTDRPGLEDSPTPIVDGTYRGDLTGYTQEFRLGATPGAPWQWQAGLAWLRFDHHVQTLGPTPFEDEALDTLPYNIDSAPVWPINTPLGPLMGRSDGYLLYALFNGLVTERALFGEVTRMFWDRWELSLGARWFRTQLQADTLVAGAQIIALTGKTQSREQQEFGEAGLNPKISLRYLLNDNVSLYALAAKGFQFGGVQLIQLNLAAQAAAAGQGAAPTFQPYKSSNLWNYELGARTGWWDERLHFDATLFHMVWKDLQIPVTIQTAPGVSFSGIIVNVGRADSTGAEVGLRLTPVTGLTLGSAASWVAAMTKTTLVTQSATYPPGTGLPGAAKFQIANSLSYELPWSFLGDWTTGASVTQSYVGSAWNDLDHAATYGGYTTLDVGAHLTNSAMRWAPDLRLTVTNLLDDRGVAGTSTCSVCRADDVFFVQPRTGTVSMTVRF